MPEEIAVVLPTFNRRDITAKCVSRLLAQSLKVQIIVCDSNSSDGTRDFLPQSDNITILNVGNEAWWSEATNEGIKWALEHNYKKIVLLNDDVGFEENLIELLDNLSQRYQNSIISPAQFNVRLKYHFLGFIFSGWIKKRGVISSPPITSNVFIDASNGCCLFIPDIIFFKAGYIDHVNCPHLFGDIEFLSRIKNAGFNILATPNIVISQDGNTDYQSKTRLKNMFTHKGSPYHFRSYLKFGETLFKGKINFFVLGVNYHLSYLQSIYHFVLYKLKSNLYKSSNRCN